MDYDGLLGKEIVLLDALSFLELEMPCLSFHRQPSLPAFLHYC